MWDTHTVQAIRGLVATLVTLGLTLLASAAMAEERTNGFFDVYAGLAVLPESDVPDWTFADVLPTLGARAGISFNDTWAVALRTWYFQSDAKEEQTTASDLAVLGLSLELLGRWQLDRRWATYAFLGPAMAVTTLDRQRRNSRTEDDARSVAPGASAGVGVDAHLVGRLSAFSEVHGSLFYPSFHFPDRTITPRLLNFNWLIGLRMGF
jgi:outer membrane protein with beta-barrel domain